MTLNKGGRSLLAPETEKRAGGRQRVVELGSLSIAYLSDLSDVRIDRRWSEVRDRNPKTYAIWIPTAAAILITQGRAHETVVLPGSFAFTASDRPYSVRSRQGEPLALNLLHISVPEHLMRACIPEVDDLCGLAFRGDNEAVLLAQDIFRSALSRATNDLKSVTGERLGMAVLELVISGMRKELEQTRHDAKELTLNRVHDYIQLHISDPGLTAPKVARACGVSTRSLHYLMSGKSTTFANHLRSCRLALAKDLLQRRDCARHSIRTIGYMAGFQSASHFSQAYKAHFGCSPSCERMDLGTNGFEVPSASDGQVYSDIQAVSDRSEYPHDIQ